MVYKLKKNNIRLYKKLYVKTSKGRRAQYKKPFLNRKLGLE